LRARASHFSGEVKGSTTGLSTLPIDITYTTIVDGLTTGQSRNISMGPTIAFTQLLTAIGTVSSNSFIGTLGTEVNFVASATIDVAPIPGPVFVGLTSPSLDGDSATLDLTYNYSPVPEPSQTVVVAAFFSILLLLTRRRLVEKPPNPPGIANNVSPHAGRSADKAASDKFFHFSTSRSSQGR
jgi:hypothetical protein